MPKKESKREKNERELPAKSDLELKIGPFLKEFCLGWRPVRDKFFPQLIVFKSLLLGIK